MTVFQKAWDLLKVGYIPGDVQNPQDIDLPPDHPALNPRPADSISDSSMAHRNAGDISLMAKDLFLDTIIAHLETGQEDYVMDELRKEGYIGTFGRGTSTSLEEHVEDGRRMAIAQVRDWMGLR